MNVIEAEPTPLGVAIPADRTLIEANIRVVFGDLTAERINGLPPRAQSLVGGVVRELGEDTVFYDQIQPHLETKATLTQSLDQIRDETQTQLEPLKWDLDDLKPSLRRSLSEQQRTKDMLDRTRGLVRWFYGFLHSRWESKYENNLARREEIEARINETREEGYQRIEPLQLLLFRARSALEEAKRSWVLGSRNRVLSYAITQLANNPWERQRYFRNFLKQESKSQKPDYDSLIREYRELVVGTVTPMGLVGAGAVEISSQQPTEVNGKIQKGKWIYKDENKDDEPRKEEEKFPYSIGKKESYMENNEIRTRVVLVSEEEAVELIERMARKVVKKDALRQEGVNDLVRSLRRDPMGSGTEYLEDRHVTIGTNELIRLRQLAPHERRGLSFKDPSLQHIRFVYFIYKVKDQPVVVIEKIASHGDTQEKYGSRKF